MSDSSARHAISITMTADMRQAMTDIANVQKQLNRVKMTRMGLGRGSADKATLRALDEEIAALQNYSAQLAENAGLAQNLGRVTADSVTKDMNAITAGNGRLQQSFGQLGFAVEDFFSVFDTMGVRGGLRAAGNNLSMIARTLAGPVYGGLMGIGLVALPLVMKLFGETDEAVKKSRNTLEDYIATLEHAQKLRQMGVEHQFSLEDIEDIESLKDAEEQIKEIEREITKLSNKTKDFKEKSAKIGEAFTDERMSDVGHKIGRELQAAGGELEKFRMEVPKLQQEFRDALTLDPANFEEALAKYVKGLKQLRRTIEEEIEERQGNIFGQYSDLSTFQQGSKNKAMHDALAAVNEELEKTKGNDEKIVEYRKAANELVKEMALHEQGAADTQERLTELEQKKKELKEEQLRIESKQREKEHQKDLMDAMKMIQDMEVQGMNKTEQALDAMDEKLRQVKGTARDVGRAFGFGSAEHERAKTAAQKAQAMVIQTTLKSLTGMLHKVDEVQQKFVKEGGQVTGPNIAEAVAAVQGLAEAQITEAKNRKEPEKAPPQPDVVAAIESLKEALNKLGFPHLTKV